MKDKLKVEGDGFIKEFLSAEKFDIENVKALAETFGVNLSQEFLEDAEYIWRTHLPTRGVER